MRTNNTPFTDVCKLIAVSTTEDDDGYSTQTETEREIFCSVCDGVTRSEFYEAYKAGLKLTATVEVYQDDYDCELLLEHDNKRYNIVRVYPTGYGTLELSLAEVVR